MLQSLQIKVDNLAGSWSLLDADERVDLLQEVARETIATIAAVRQEVRDGE